MKSKKVLKKQMKLSLVLIFISFANLIGCGQIAQKNTDRIVKIEMNLSAFGIESDNFPSIDVVIDFLKDTSICVKSYYNPDYKGSTYSLNKKEMQEILNLLDISVIQNIKKSYKAKRTCQPVSKTIIYTNKTKFEYYDYGLEGDYPLQELYKIVYKL